MANAVELKGITKYIYDKNGKAIRGTTVKILENVDFELRKGEVHALIGANGAGKSTLMNVLGGIIPAEEGKIIIDGQEVVLESPLKAREQGISFIHQELNLCTNLDVAHNIFLGREPVKNKMMDEETMYRESQKLVDSIGMDIQVRQKVSHYSTSVQQIIEILKALSFESKVVIMDEPTASLSHSEVDILYGLIRGLKERGISIIYISHRFEEIREIADRGTVLRDGKYVGTFDMVDFDHEKIVNMMVGHTAKASEFVNIPITQKKVLEVENVRLKPNWTSTVTLHVNAGEIVGLAGLVGAGRTELAKAIFTGKGYYGGTIKIEGETIVKTNPTQSIRRGVAYLSEDRKTEGLILPMSIKRNLTLASLFQMFPNHWIKVKEEDRRAQEMMNRLVIKAQSKEQAVNTLSGGNQQRVVFGKWIGINPKLLILDEPTRGVDVNAKNEIYEIIRDIARSGIAVLLISSELPEITGLAHRVYVIKNGGIVAEITDRKEMEQEQILKYVL